MGFLSGIGGILNDVMGVTSAGKQNQAYALQSAQVNNQYQKEFAQNQLQWTVQDAQKAGVNPIYAIGGGGSGAGGSGGTSSGSSQPTGNIVGTLEAMGNIYNSTRATTATTNLQNAQSLQIIEMLPLEKGYKEALTKQVLSGVPLNEALTKYNKEKAYTEKFNNFKQKMAYYTTQAHTKEQKEIIEKANKLYEQGKQKEAERLILLGF